MDLDEIYFAFGPDGKYIFDCPKTWLRRDLPDYLEEEFADLKLSKIYCLAWSDYGDGDVYCAWKDCNGEDWTWKSRQLKDTAVNLVNLIDEHHVDMRVAFGERGRYLAWTASGIRRWYVLNAYKDEIGTALCKYDSIRVACLGIDDDYFILSKDGRFNHNLRANYPVLDNILDDLDPGNIIFLALNPFRVGQFFLLLANNSAIFSVDHSKRAQLESALARCGITSNALASTRVEDTPRMPPEARNRNIAKGLLRHAFGRSVVGAVVSSITTALIGSVASCAVM